MGECVNESINSLILRETSIVNRQSTAPPAIDCNADQIFSLGEKALKGRHIPAMGNAHRRSAKCESTAYPIRET
jgi:hypothetical protein